MKSLKLKPFNPETFIGPNWTIESQDQAALALNEIDFSQVTFQHGLKDDETHITGEEKLKRLNGTGVLLDARVAQALYEEKDQKTLKWIYETHNISWFELAGSVLRDSSGDRCFLYLSRSDDGSWGVALRLAPQRSRSRRRLAAPRKR